MRGVWPVAEVRAAEEALMRQVPGEVLMQRAAAGLAATCARMSPAVYGLRVCLLVGGGHNGGDTLHAGARLALRGAAVQALLLSPDRVHRGGLAALLAAGGRAMEATAPSGSVGSATRASLNAVRSADLVLDGIVGIGGRGGLRPGAAELAEAARDSGARRVAVDVPSGVEPDTGEVPGVAFEADLTVTFGCLKPGLVVGAGVTAAGRVRVVDIGIGPYLPDPMLRVPGPADIAELLPLPLASDDKYRRGVVGVLAGSPRYTGAAVLSVGAATHGGAGMVRYVGGAAEQVRASWPEVVVSEERPGQAGRVQAWAVGPGMGTGDDALGLLAEVLSTDLPVLLDADAITLVARQPELVRGRANTVLTPHDGEFARLAGPVGADRTGAVRAAATDLGVTILLKGAATVIAGPDGVAQVISAGTSWLATAGSGDVLTGLGGSLLAAHTVRGVDPTRSVMCAAHLHGVAGELAGPGCAASDVLASVPAAIRAALATVEVRPGRDGLPAPWRDRARPRRSAE